MEQRLEEYHLEVSYSRQEGYHLVGSEYAKREMMITFIRGTKDSKRKRYDHGHLSDQ